MEISPVAGIRVMPIAKARPVDPELTAFFDIESTARPDDDTYSRSAKKAAGAEENGEEYTEELEEPELEVGAKSTPVRPGGGISFFA